MANIRNEREDMTTDPADIKSFIRKHRKYLCVRKFDILDDMNTFLKKYK